MIGIKKDRSIKEETLLSIRRRTIKMKNNNTKLVRLSNIFYTKIYSYEGYN
jgi:hypothetical protein